jgi:hypothetical protein
MNIFPAWANLGTWAFLHSWQKKIAHVPKFAHAGMPYSDIDVLGSNTNHVVISASQ